MSSRVGGRARRIRGKGGARKADRTPKSAADLDAEMEVCTFETFCCPPNLRLRPSGLYCQQWSRCRCLSNFDPLSVFLTCLLYIVFLCCLFQYSYYPYPPQFHDRIVSFSVLSLALLRNIFVIANISYARMLRAFLFLIS